MRRVPTVVIVVIVATAAAMVSFSGAPTAGATGTQADCAFPVERTDATGTAVNVSSDPDEIVALQPSAAQTLWEIGARDEVIGMPVNQYTAGLEGSQRPTNVVGGDDYTVSVETVVDLEPDLVLSPNATPTDTVDALRDAGLTVYHFREARSIADVYEKTRLTGRLTGHCDGADETVDSMRERIDRVQRAVAGEPRPTVVYPLGGGFVAGSDTFLHEIVTTAGGRNLAAEAGISGYGQLSQEVIVDGNPDWLILNDGLPRSAIQMDAYNETTAVREGQVVRVDPNEANQPAPRIVRPIETIARALHPGAMAAANETTETPTPPTTTARPTTTPTGTAASGQPGFGIAAVLVAVLVLVRFTLRRRSR